MRRASSVSTVHVRISTSYRVLHIEIAIKINEGLGLALVGVLSGFSWLSLA